MWRNSNGILRNKRLTMTQSVLRLSTQASSSILDPEWGQKWKGATCGATPWPLAGIDVTNSAEKTLLGLQPYRAVPPLKWSRSLYRKSENNVIKSFCRLVQAYNNCPTIVSFQRPRRRSETMRFGTRAVYMSTRQAVDKTVFRFLRTLPFGS